MLQYHGSGDEKGFIREVMSVECFVVRIWNVEFGRQNRGSRDTSAEKNEENKMCWQSA